MIPLPIVLGTLGAFLIMLVVIRFDEAMRQQHISDLEDQLVDQMHRADKLEKQLTGGKR